MVARVRHKAALLIADDGNPNEIGPNKWNDDHLLEGLDAAFIGASAFSSATTNIGNGAFDPVAFTNEDFDTDGFHDNSTNTSRFTIPAGLGGKYLCRGNVEWDTNATGDRVACIFKNGSDTSRGWSRDVANSIGLGQPVAAVLDLNATDYVELRVFQNSGTTRTVGGNGRTNFSIYKLDSGKLGQGIGAKAYNSTTQNIDTATATPLTLDTEDFDTDGFHSTSSNTSRFTIPAGLGGKYIVNAATYAPFVGGGFKYFSLNKNGSTTALYRYEGHDSATISVGMYFTDIFELVPNDYIEMWFEHNQGTTQSVGHASARRVQTQLSIMRLDSQGSPYVGAKWTSGATFPTDPGVGNRHTRTDRNIDYVWDGTQWLSTTLYRENIAITDNLFPLSVGAGTTTGRWAPWHTTNLWLESLYATFYVSGTNDGSNYWTFEMSKYTAGNTPTVVASFNTSGDSGSSWTTKVVPIGALFDATTYKEIQVLGTKTGSPGSIYVPTAIAYRLIG